MNNDLYSVMKRQCNDIPLENEKKKETIDMVKILDRDGHQNIFLLINSFNREYSLDYQGKTVKNHDNKLIDAKFTMDSFPNLLQQILHKFSKIHYASMQEELKRKQAERNDDERM